MSEVILPEEVSVPRGETDEGRGSQRRAYER